ncbi:MAG: YCF48-related protein, partial [Salinisphaera sp.]|nr:YCF48-related protein [Salinisphaera sp.]
MSVSNKTKRTNGRRHGRGVATLLAVAALLGAQPVCAADQAGDKKDAPPPKPIPSVMAPLARYDLLLDVDKVGDDHYVAVGARGVIIRSSDGTHWQQVQTPVQAALTAVDFVDENHGWAVGYAATILATTDGGATWTLQKWAPELQNQFLDVMFLNKNKGFAIGTYGMFYKTHDAGRTWTKFDSRLTQRGWHLNGIVRLDDGTLVIAGETGLLVKSTDGGKRWQLLDAPYSGTYFGLAQLGPQGVLLYGLRGHAFVIDDIGTVAVLPPDTDLMYDFKKPPTMDTKESSAAAAASKDEALANAEAKAIAKEVAKSNWQAVDNHGSILSLFGGVATADGGYVLVGRNGVIWAGDDHGPQVTQLPNPRDGSLADVVTTPDGDLVL